MQFLLIFGTFLLFFECNFPECVIIVPKMLEQSPINFNSTHTSDSCKASSYTVTNCYPECTYHHFDIKIKKNFLRREKPLGRGNPSPHSTPSPWRSIIDLPVPPPPKLKCWICLVTVTNFWQFWEDCKPLGA